jgi:hypothetical protein
MINPSSMVNNARYGWLSHPSSMINCEHANIITLNIINVCTKNCVLLLSISIQQLFHVFSYLASCISRLCSIILCFVSGDIAILFKSSIFLYNNHLKNPLNIVTFHSHIINNFERLTTSPYQIQTYQFITSLFI